MAAACAFTMASLLPAGAEPAVAQQQAQQVQQRDTTAEAMPPVHRSNVLLDAAIDRASYRLGPGDVLDVALTGSLNRTLRLTVGAEGAALVPGIGVVRLQDLTLDAAQHAVQQAARRFYREMEVALALAEPRAFKVYVLGAVPEPGMRTASAAMRVSELLPQDADSVIRRDLTMLRGGRDTIRLDLLPFALGGDMSANPTLREGDVLLVTPVEETVQVYGSVVFPGVVEHRPGESLAELLSIVNVHGRFPANAGDTVRISRVSGRTTRELHVMTRQEAVGERGRSFELRPWDAVFVAPLGTFSERRVVQITGEVARPGHYPLIPESLTVSGLVALAGGTLPTASLRHAVLHRTAVHSEESPLRDVPREVLSPDERRMVQALERGHQNMVVLDLEALLNGGTAFDQPLQPGDSLHVPPRHDQVVVVGAVATPGILPYSPGLGPHAYIALAGGRSSRADRSGIRVMRGRPGIELTLRDVRFVEPGDQIIVPFREHRTVMERLQLVGSVASIVSGVVLTVLTVRQIF
jgi:polysaccharide biosynthesis/export protein